MLSLEFDTPEEFDEYFDSDNLESKREVAETIFEGIRKAMAEDKNEAELFQISFTSGDDALDVTLPRSEWSVALENCQKKFHEMELFDEAIDVYNLRKEVW